MPSITTINDRFAVLNTGYKTNPGEEVGMLILEPGHSTSISGNTVSQVEFNDRVKGWVWHPADANNGNYNGWWGTSFTRDDPDGPNKPQQAFSTDKADIGDFAAIRSDYNSDINLFPGKNGHVVFNDDNFAPNTSYKFPKDRASANQVLADRDGDGILRWMDVDNLNKLIDTNYTSGDLPTSTGDNSIAIGIDSEAQGDHSVAIGYNNRASGNYSHAEGNTTWATGIGSHAEGQQTRAEGNYSHSEGLNSNATAHYTHAEGYTTEASGISSHAEGYTTTASGDYSHSEGFESVASGRSSHAEGSETIASGACSHSEGENTTASGDFSSVSGKDTVASGKAAVASGIGAKSSMDGQWAHGISTNRNVFQRSLYYFSDVINTDNTGNVTVETPQRLLIPHYSVWGIQLNVVVKDTINKTSLYYTSGNKSICVQCVDDTEDVLMYGYDNNVLPGPDIGINITPNSEDDPNQPSTTMNTLFNYNGYSSGTMNLQLAFDETPSSPVTGFEQIKISLSASNLENLISLDYGIELSVLELNKI